MTMHFSRLSLRKKLALSALIAAGFLGLAPQAEAANYYWNTTTTGNWADGLNWSDTATTGGITGVIPGSADSVFFNQSSVNGAETVQLTTGTTTTITNITFNNTGSTAINSTTTTAATLSVSGLITVNTGAGGSVTIGGTNPVTLTGAGGISVTSGLLTLNAGNTFSGDISIDGANSILAIPGNSYTTTSPLGTKAAVYKTVNINNGGTFRITGTGNYNVNTPNATNVGAGQVFNIGANGATFDIVDPVGQLTIDDGSGAGTAWTNSQLQGSGTITKTGAGILSLGSGTSTNAVFTGAIVINQGTLQTGGTGTQLGSTGAGTTIASGASFNLNGATVGAEPLTISGTGISGNNVLRNASTTSATFGGAITLAAASQIGVSTTGSMTLSNTISGAFPLTINSTGTGAVILSGASTTYTGGITVQSGTLRATTNASAFGANSNIITLGNPAVLAPSQPIVLDMNVGGTFSQPIVLATGAFTGGLAISSPNTGTMAVVAGGVTGNNNLQIRGTNAQGIQFSTGAIDNTGTVTNNGTGGGAAFVGSNITANVTNVTQNSTTSPLILSGTNTYGTTTVTSGTLTFSTPSSIPDYPSIVAGDITVASGATLAFGFGAASGQFSTAEIVGFGSTGTPMGFATTGSFLGIDTTTAVGGTATFAGVLTNPTGTTLGFNKVGAGTLILTGANTYNGPTLVSRGILTAVDGVGIPAGSNLQISGTGGTGAVAATFAPPTASYERALGTGAGQLQVLGNLSGFTATQPNQVVAIGTVASPTALTWGSTSFNPAQLVLNDTGATSTIDFRNPINFDTAARTVTVNTSTAATSATLSGVLSSTSAAGGLTKGGAGILNVTNPGNTYTGPTAVTTGTLSFNGPGTLPSASAVTISPGATLQLLNDASGTIAYGNAINLAGTTATFLNVGNNGGATTNSTVALGSLNAPATAANTQTALTVTGSNGYGVTFTDAKLAGGTGQTLTLTANTDVKILGAVTNRMTGFGSTNFSTLTIQGTSTGSSINGIISDASGGSITAGGYTPVTKTGTGTWTFRGANTYTGGTTISAGTLAIDGGSGGSIGGSLVTVSASGTLSIIGNTNIGTGISTLQNTQGAVVVAGGATPATRGTISLLDNSINTLTIRGNNFATAAAQSLTLGGTAGNSSTINFDSNNTSVDSIAVSGSTNSNKVLLNAGGATINITPLSGTALGAGTYPLLTYATGSTFTGAFTLGSYTSAPNTIAYLSAPGTTQLTLNVIAAASGNVFWAGTQDGNWNTNPTGTTNFVNAYTGGAAAQLPGNNANVFFTSSSAAANFTTSLGQAFTLNSLNFTGTGTPAATNAVTIGGTSTLTLTPTAGFSDQNAVAYASGVGLAVQAGSAAHTISAPVALGVSQTWQQDSVNALTVSGVISGTGMGLTKTGTGTIALTGANTYDGATTVNNGTLQLGAGGTTGTLPTAGTIVVNGTGTFAINRSDAITQGTQYSSSAITGTGSVTKLNTNTLTVATANSYTGGTFIKAGVFDLRNAAGAGGTNVAYTDIVLDGGALNARFDTSGTTFFNNIVVNTVGTSNAANMRIGNITASTTNPLIANFGTVTFNGTSALGMDEVGMTSPGSYQLNVTGVNLNGNGTFDLGAGAATTSFGRLQINGPITETGGSRTLTFNQAKTGDTQFRATLTGTGSYTGNTNIGYATVFAQNAAAFGTTNSTINITNTAGSLETQLDTNSIFTQNISLTTANTVRVGRQTSGAGVTSTFATLTPTTTFTAAVGSNVTTDSPYGLLFTGTALTGNTTFTVANNGTGTGTLGLGTLSGTGNITKTGTGTLNISGGTFTGNLTLSAGNILGVSGGSLVANNTANTALFSVGNPAGTGRFIADFRGLSNLTINYTDPASSVRVNPIGGNSDGSYSTMYLPTTAAGTATITAGQLIIGNDASNNGSAGQVNQVFLGSGLTTLNVNTLNIANLATGRDLGQLLYEAGNTTGSVKIRALDGVGRAAVNVGAGTTTTSTGATPGNLFDVSNHNADLLLSTVAVGTQIRNSAITSTFSFNQGTLDANTFTVGTRGATTNTATTAGVVNFGGGTVAINNGFSVVGNNSAGVGTTSGTVNLSGGTITIGATSGNSFVLADATVAGGTANGTLNISGTANVVLAGNIGVGSTTGTENSTVSLSGGLLDMAGNNIANLNNLNFTGGILRNAGTINRAVTQSGGTLERTTAGTTQITGAYTTSGAGTVTNLSNAAAILDATGGVTIGTGALLKGIGTVLNSTVVSGTVAPGNSIGTLTVMGNATFNAGSTFEAELGAANSSDLLALTSPTSNLSLASNTDTLSLLSSNDPGTFTIIDYNGSRSGGIFDIVKYNGITQSLLTTQTAVTNPAGFIGTGDLYTYGNVSVFYNDSNTSVQVGGLVAIPEPSTLVLGGLTLLGFAGVGLRRRRLASQQA